MCDPFENVKQKQIKVIDVKIWHIGTVVGVKNIKKCSLGAQEERVSVTTTRSYENFFY